MHRASETAAAGLGPCDGSPIPPLSACRRASKQLSGGFTIIELMVVVVIISLLAALAVTAYGRYRARSHHAETNLNLKGIFVAETAYFAEQHRYNNFTAIGFKLVGPTNRYTYRAEGTDDLGNGTGVIETIPTQIGTPTPDNTLLPAASSGTGFTATSTANIDSDATIDQWHVSDWPPVAGSNDISDFTQ